MLEGIAISLGDIGLSALVTFAVLLVFTGRLKPKSDLDRADRETERWRTAWEKSEAARAVETETRQELQHQVGELLEGSRVTISLLRAHFDARAPVREDTS